jgi:hypothetical protein
MFIRNYLSFLLLFVFASPAMAQQASFIYIQTENNLPFKAEFSGADYASSTTGYLVIPQVPAGKHTMKVIFSADISKPYNFIVEVADKARGFSLRQETDNSWSLFDMIDFSLIKGTVFVEPPLKPKPVTETAAVLAEKKETNPPVLKGQAAKITGITKIFDKTGSTGIDQVYTITNGNKIDTIALFIPDIEEKPKQAASTSLFISEPAKSDQASMAVLVYNSRRYLRFSK